MLLSICTVGFKIVCFRMQAIFILNLVSFFYTFDVQDRYNKYTYQIFICYSTTDHLRVNTRDASSGPTPTLINKAGKIQKSLSTNSFP